MRQNPQTPRARFGLAFVMLARRWRRTLQVKVAEAGLTDATWLPLFYLDEFGDGISQKALACRVDLDGSTLVRLVDILEAKGLVERRVDGADRRVKLVFLTPSGRRETAALRVALAEADAEFLAEIGDDEIVAMLDAFARIGARLTDHEDAAK